MRSERENRELNAPDLYVVVDLHAQRLGLLGVLSIARECEAKAVLTELLG